MPTNILLTGSTGNLGSYLLHTLSFDPSVSHIYCLNRSGTTDTQSRQRSSLRQRGLALPAVSPDFAKITHLTGDLTKPDLALDANVLDTLRSIGRTPLTILHNAWPVDFNRHFSSFVPQLHSLQNLISLALSCAPHTARFVFISSISAAGNWGALPGARASVPEALLDDWKVARLGYGQAKLVAERIVAEAARVSALEGVIVRVGQVAGPVERGLEGSWPRQEWLPSLVRSSAHMGFVPNSLGPMDRVDWVPVDLLAKIVADLVRAGGDASATNGVANGDAKATSNGVLTINTSVNNNTITEVATPHGTPKPNNFQSPTTPTKLKESTFPPTTNGTAEKPASLATAKKHKPSLFSRSRNSRFSSSPKQPTGLGTMEYYHVVNPHGTPWSTLLPAVISTLQAAPTVLHPASMAQPHKNIRVVSFAEWVDRLTKSAKDAADSAAATGTTVKKDEQLGIPSARTSGVPPNAAAHINGTTTARTSTQSKRTSYRLSAPPAGGTADLDTNPAVKLLPFFQTLKDKAVHLPKARSVVLETKGTETVSATLRELGGCGVEWMGLWMRQWGRERSF